MGFSGNDLTGAGLNPVTHFKSQLGGDLHLFFVLNSPRTLRYQLGSWTEGLFWRSRLALENAARYIGLNKS
jgi:hypothetical protein